MVIFINFFTNYDVKVCIGFHFLWLQIPCFFFFSSSSSSSSSSFSIDSIFLCPHVYNFSLHNCVLPIRIVCI